MFSQFNNSTLRTVKALNKTATSASVNTAAAHLVSDKLWKQAMSEVNKIHTVPSKTLRN